MGRIFWALSEGAAATALLAAGGSQALTALQTASIAAAFPFIFLLIIMVYSLLRAFQMDEELLARSGKGKGHVHELHPYPMNGLEAPSNIHEVVKSTDSIMNGHSVEIPKDNVESMDDNVHDHYMNSKEDEMNKEWRLGFFEDIFGGSNIIIALLKGLFLPCLLQHSNGMNIKMYGMPGLGPNLCVDLLWMIAVFATPITIIAMDIASHWQDGMVAFSGVIWVAFVVIGASHRMKIRQYYQLQGNPVVDVMSYCCCYCLAVRQEYVQCNPTVLL